MAFAAAFVGGGVLIFWLTTATGELFLFLLLRPQLGRASRSAVPEEPGLEAMLRKRPMLQAVSATLLCTTSLIVVRMIVV